MRLGASMPVKKSAKILQIGNYPPPMCGWAIQTKLVTDELRRRGHNCQVLKINENRQIKDPAYVDVQNGLDYFFKVLRYALSGYRLNVHVNGQSKKGYLLTLAAVSVGRLSFHPALITFHGGLSQEYFPRLDSARWRWAFKILFHLAGGIACDSGPVKSAIESYGISSHKIQAIETFSSQYLDFQPANLGSEIEDFLQSHSPVFFCYVSFRPEYRLEVLRSAMAIFRKDFPKAGFVWLGFPGKEMVPALEYVSNWTSDERVSLLLLGNLEHNQFLSLLTRCFAYIRTPACDGVSASVLESLTLGVPVIASENGTRPSGVITYAENDAQALCEQMLYLMRNRAQIRMDLDESVGDNVGRMADWLCGDPLSVRSEEVSHAV
jgi:glycosyltransferase involved in cell wall biosynthesis